MYIFSVFQVIPISDYMGMQFLHENIVFLKGLNKDLNIMSTKLKIKCIKIFHVVIFKRVHMYNAALE